LRNRGFHFFQEQDDTVSLFENLGHPPDESWFMDNAKYFSIFHIFDWVDSLNSARLIQEGKRLSIGNTIASRWSNAAGKSGHWRARLSGQQV
jgi:hypothetical protein